jgi:hypothetical protein
MLTILPRFCDLHGREHWTAGQEHAAQVDRHHPVPFLYRYFQPRAARQNAHQRGIVDEHVDAAETLKRGLRHGVGAFLACDIGQETEDLQALCAQCAGDGFGGSAIDVGRNDPGAGSGELLDIDLPDTFAPTGDDHGSSIEIETVAHAVPHG